MSMSTSRDCGPSIVGRAHVENDVLSRQTPIGSGSYRARAPIRSAIVFAAMLELGIVGARATTISGETLDVTTDNSILNGHSDVDIGAGHSGTVNVISPGVVTSTGGWHVGGSSDGAIGTLNITSGGVVTTGDPFNVGQSAKADGIVLVSDPSFQTHR